jgi:hypothetical protein
MSLATIPAEVQGLVDLATEDYDAFWGSLDGRDHDLTESLTRSYDDYDAVFIHDSTVYELAYNEITRSFEVDELGPESDLKIYADLELTGLGTDEELDEFIDELSSSLPGIEVVKGVSKNGTSGAEWIRESRRVVKAWEDAIAAV